MSKPSSPAQASADVAQAGKRERLPIFISLAVPGGGQFAQKRIFWGIFFQVALTIDFLILLIRMIQNIIHTFGTIMDGAEPSPGMLFVGLGWPFLVLFAIYIWNLVDAYLASRVKTEKS